MWQSRALRPALAGYLAGLATAGVIAVLTPAAPDAETEAPAQTPPSISARAQEPVPTSAEAPRHSAPISAETRDRIAPLEARLAADPGDLPVRKQLAVVLLREQQLMLAYEHASEILKARADDPDGLYIHGVVRLAMGHAPRAIELLDRVLVRYPNHVPALEARAEAQRKIGDEGGAALTAERARLATRGGDSEVEQLLAAARGGTLLEMMRSSGPSPPATAQDPSPPATAQADSNGE